MVQAMADQGSGGAYEISQRMTAMVGWGATTNFQEDWTWDQAAETYALDKDMADKLRKNNPQVTLAVLLVLLLCKSGKERLSMQRMSCVASAVARGKEPTQRRAEKPTAP